MIENTQRKWWRGGVIYQIYPRSFQDSNGDGIGDLKGITSRLDHVAKLGADAIWLSPFFTSPMKDLGYDVADYCDVNPEFGTLADFDALVERAHELGLKVMIDQVLSHSSDEHAWFKESRKSKDNPKADWYVWADRKEDGSPPNNWISVFGGSAWQWDVRRKQYYLHNFLTSQPDLNFHNVEVQDALLDTVRFWLDRGVDGFRLDTVNFYFHDAELRNNPPANELAGEVPDTNPYGFQEHVYDKTRPENIEFLKRFRALLDEYDDRAAVGEVGDAGPRALETIARYTDGDDKLHMCYSFEMLGPKFTPAHIRHCVEDVATVSAEIGDGSSWPCWAFSNHDVMRHVSRFAKPGIEATDLAKMSAALLFTLRGSICVYQGEELGLPEAELEFEEIIDPYGIEFWPEFKGRDGCRTPMIWEGNGKFGGFSEGKSAWLPVKENHLAYAVNAQNGIEGSVLEYYRTLLKTRRESDALFCGDLEFLETGEAILTFKRTSGHEALFCAFNFGDSPQAVTIPSAFTSLTALPGSRNHEILDGQVKLGPMGVFIGR